MKMKNRVALATLAMMIAASTAAYGQVGNGRGARLGQTRAVNANAAAATANQATATAQTTAAATPEQAAATPAPKASSDGSEFVIAKDATPEQLVEQATSLLSTEIAFESEKEYSAWVAKMLQTVGLIADRILTLKPTDEYFVEAISLKGQVLCYQASLDSSILPQLKKYADALANNKRVQSLEDGRNATLAFTGVYLQAVVADIAERQGTAKELAAAMNEVDAFVKAHPETSDMTVDLVFPVQVIAANLGNPKLPDQIWAPIRKTLAASETPEAQNALMMLDGTIRYSQLVGAPFEWQGCDAKGKKFDAETVKGRVVVVDFWASWCQQSAEYHEQLKKLYDLYHAQGFEIVSYNLDPKLEDMDAYLTKNPLPWIVLSDRATVDAKETSLAAYYGIGEIPTMILIGGDGKVASTDLSLESLAATLQNVFSKSAAVPASSSKTPATTGSATKPSSAKPAATKTTTPTTRRATTR